MREFKRTDKGKFGNKRFERPSKFQNRHFGKSPKEFGARSKPSHLQLFEATCGRCGKDCEVPFRPTGSRPVLCRNCFQSREAPAPQEKPKGQNELAEINRKLDKILRALNLD